MDDTCIVSRHFVLLLVGARPQSDATQTCRRFQSKKDNRCIFVLAAATVETRSLLILCDGSNAGDGMMMRLRDENINSHN